MSYINLLANDIWSDLDITNRGRAVIAAQVSEARQNELRTIMLGHIAQMRAASPEEMGEIMLVQALTEQAVLDNAAARADMARLNQVMAHEQAVARLALPVLDPAVEQDAVDRDDAQAVVNAATADTLGLYSLRNPVEAAVEVAP